MSARIAAQVRWNELTLSCVLYGAEDDKVRMMYTSKIADNIPKILRMFSSGSVDDSAYQRARKALPRDGREEARTRRQVRRDTRWLQLDRHV